MGTDDNEPRFEGTPGQCVHCHRDDYDRSTFPGHSHFALTCAECHSTAAWRPTLHPPRPDAWADVDAGMAVQWMHEAGTPLLIHGHTHRPGGDELAPGFHRLVLTDWDFDQGPPRGDVLRLSARGPVRVALATAAPAASADARP